MRLSLAAGALLALCACVPPSTPQGQAAARYETCSPCHGPAGSGRADLQVPPIGGLPPWYVEAQLTKFRDGWRGVHPDDIAGMRMRPMALTLPTADDVKAMAEYVSTLPGGPQAPTLTDADASRGQALFATCVACHQADGSGNEALKAPKIAGNADWYVATQLQHFKSGVRGANPADAQGALMRPMAMTLADDQAIKDVAAYVNSLGRK